MHDKVLIIDFGSQVTQLIARRVREMGVYSEIVPFQKAAEAFARMKPKAVILSGGPARVPRRAAPRAPQVVFEAGVPVLGICYGEQTMARSSAARSKAATPRIRPRRSRGQGSRRRCSRACGRRAESIRCG